MVWVEMRRRFLAPEMSAPSFFSDRLTGSGRAFVCRACIAALMIKNIYANELNVNIFYHYVKLSGLDRWGATEP
jgi:hypothetical protein